MHRLCDLGQVIQLIFLTCTMRPVTSLTGLNQRVLVKCLVQGLALSEHWVLTLKERLPHGCLECITSCGESGVYGLRAWCPLAHLYFFSKAGESEMRDPASPTSPGGGRDRWGGRLSDTSLSSADCFIEQGWFDGSRKLFPHFCPLPLLMVLITLSAFWWVGSW